MKNSDASKLVYISYIAATAEKVWDALTKNHLRKQWWRGHYMESDWKTGSSFISYFPDGSKEATGKIIEADPPRKLSYESHVEFRTEYETEPSRLTFEIESYPSIVKLKLTYQAGEKLIALSRPGWPAVISSLKSLIETGKALPLVEVFGPERNPAKE